MPTFTDCLQCAEGCDNVQDEVCMSINEYDSELDSQADGAGQLLMQVLTFACYC